MRCNRPAKNPAPCAKVSTHTCLARQIGDVAYEIGSMGSPPPGARGPGAHPASKVSEAAGTRPVDSVRAAASAAPEGAVTRAVPWVARVTAGRKAVRRPARESTPSPKDGARKKSPEKPLGLRVP